MHQVWRDLQRHLIDFDRYMDGVQKFDKYSTYVDRNLVFYSTM